jgi:CHAD domain-containing protein
MLIAEIGRALAAAREADVAAAESRRLIERGDGRIGSAMARLVERFDAERQAAHDRLPAAAEISARLRACEADARSLPERFPAGRLLAEALGRSYRRGRRDWRALEDGITVETMHDWRKRVKRRRHLSALVPIATEVTTGSIQHDLEALGEMLGEEHDLALLQHRLEAERSRPEGREAHDEVADLLARRRRKLAKRALDLGEELYGQRGRRFDAELAGLAELC